jgi:hypothetical protein
MSHEYNNLVPTRALTRRRNGRQQACEPCSRRKVACDHRVPVCSRCKRGRVSEKCVYLPEKRASPAQQQPSPGSSSAGRKTNHAGGDYHENVPAPLPADDATAVGNGNSVQSPSNATTATRRLGNAGYLGATSFSAVLQEAQNSLSSAQMNAAPDSEGVSPADSYLKPHTKTALDKQIFDMAMNILRKIPDRESSYSMFRHFSNPNRAWCHLAAEWLLDSMWTTYGSALECQSQKSAGAPLAKMAESLCHNTAQPWAETETDPREWFDMFSGPSMRWEALGILFIYWSFGAKCFPKNIPIRGTLLPETERTRLRAYYKDCAWRCTELARRSKSCNSIVVWVLWKHSMIESMISGDAGEFRMTD